MIAAGMCAVMAAPTAGARQNDAADWLEHPIDTTWPVYSDSAQTAATSDARWWERFEDSVLDSLVSQGLANNYDIAMATRRIEMARDRVGQARAGYYPTVGLSAGYTRSRQSGDMITPGGRATTTGYWSLGANLSWEIDIFGRVRAQVQEGQRNVKVSRAERAGVKVSLEAEIASDYIQLRVLQAQLEVARQHSESQLAAKHIAEARFDTGLASMMDVDQANQVYYSTIASIPRLESQIHNTVNAIATLLGVTPGELRRQLDPIRPIPHYIQLVATGVPMDLLRKRPDVVQAEEQIGVCASQLGIARKDWLPKLTLQGTVGVDAHNAGDLFKHNSFGYSIVPTLSWTLFDGFARKYNIAEARQQMLNAIDSYNNTVITAVNEVDDALSTYFSSLHYIKALEDVVKASSQYDSRSLDNYKNGLSPYINVAQAQMSYLESMNTLIVAKGDALNALITLYKALGGGWIDDELR